MSPGAKAITRTAEMRATTIAASAALVVLLITLPACVELPRSEKSTAREEGKASLRVQALGVAPDTSVEAMQYDLVPVDCDDGSVVGSPRTEVRPLDDAGVSGNIPKLENAPFDEASAHRVSELFEVVPEGCYDVTVTPLVAAGIPSDICGTARKERVEVFEGKTTEVILLSQCEGHDPGALEIIASLNHEPEIVDITTPDSADFACGTPTRVCMTAKDADSDPLEFELEAPDSCDVMPGEPSGDERCWTLTCGAGAAALTLRVYDLVSRDGELVRIEDWYADEGRDDESHAEAEFELHFKGLEYWPDVDADGYGDAEADGIVVCPGDDLLGLSDNDDDCDDNDPRIHPGAPEICGDGVDNDCDQAEDCAACPKVFACTATGTTPPAPHCMDCADPATGGFCFRVAEGGTLCNDNFWCAGQASCDSSRDCALSEVCVVDSCCAVGHGVCAPAKLECSLDDLGVSPEAMSTLGTATGKR